MYLCWEGGWVGRWVWMEVGHPCPHVHNNIVTSSHLFYFFLFFFLLFFLVLMSNTIQVRQRRAAAAAPLAPSNTPLLPNAYAQLRLLLLSWPRPVSQLQTEIQKRKKDLLINVVKNADSRPTTTSCRLSKGVFPKTTKNEFLPLKRVYNKEISTVQREQKE